MRSATKYHKQRDAMRGNPYILPYERGAPINLHGDSLERRAGSTDDILAWCELCPCLATYTPARWES